MKTATGSRKYGFQIALIWAVVTVFTGSALAEEAYKVGGIFSVTGRASFLGDPEKKSMEMAIDAVNAAGGIDGRKLEAVIYDTEGDPTKAVMGISKLLNKDNVLAVIGPSTTPTTLAVMPFAEKTGTPLISCAAGNKITLPVNPWVFKTAQSDILAVQTIYEHMKTQGIKKIGILTVADAFGESGREQLEAQAGNFGLTIVQADKFGGNDTDMTAQLTKIRNAAPQAIVTWTIGPVGSIVAKNKAQLGVTIPLFQCHGLPDPKYIELAGKASEGDRMPATKLMVGSALPETDPQKKVIAEFSHLYRDVYKYDKEFPINTHSGYAWDAITIVANAMRKAGTDPKALRAAIEQTKGYVGVSGVYNLTAEDHNGLDVDSMVMVQVKGGKFVPAE
ncbi:ABC transporter substrate-binding protein [Desulfococcus sp.]|uniref:ABC transporter substrate-binding protein n=1 Tax=Desulfococcus sp. TaxID=2025834 RepID=UPI003593EDFC